MAHKGGREYLQAMHSPRGLRFRMYKELQKALQQKAQMKPNQTKQRDSEIHNGPGGLSQRRHVGGWGTWKDAQKSSGKGNSNTLTLINSRENDCYQKVER